jgi:TetR/AcrR family transcriptional regulator
MDAAFAGLERARKDGRNGRERLVLTMSYYVAQLINELNCCVVLMEEQALEPEDHAKLVRQRDRFERALRAFIREGIEDGSVVPCDPKLAIFVILGAMNWVPKWFKPSGAWKSDQLNAALAQMFERLVSSSPVATMAVDVGDLPSHAEPPSSLISLAQRPRSPRAGQDKRIDKKADKKIEKKIKAGGKR